MDHKQSEPTCSSFEKCQEFFAERQGEMLAAFSRQLERAKLDLQSTVRAELEHHWKHWDEMFARVQPALVENQKLKEENQRLREELDERPSQLNIVIPQSPHTSSLRPTSVGGWVKLLAVAFGSLLAGFAAQYLGK